MATQPLWLKRHGFVSLLLLRALVKYELKNPKNAKAEESLYVLTTVVCVAQKRPWHGRVFGKYFQTIIFSF